MVTLTTADSALKNLYLNVVANQLNTSVNPLLSLLQQSNADIWGKNIIKLAPYGVNGGVGAGTEDGLLPASAENNYVTFTSTLKNLYGTIELTDKAIRASASDTGAFVNLLNSEMEGLLAASKFNLSRMLYGDGSGFLAKITVASSTTQIMTVDDMRGIYEGMVVDFVKESAPADTITGVRILQINRVAKHIKISMNITATFQTNAAQYKIYVQGSKNNEITGLGAVFGPQTTLYGVDRAQYNWMQPFSKAKTSGDAFEDIMQEAIDEVYKNNDSVVDFIVCDNASRRAYQAAMAATRVNMDVLELKGGFKTLSYNGIPVVGDKFMPAGTMYLLNSKDLVLHQLCDWQWLEGEDGSILKQKGGFPVYKATLVKYADLICNKPGGQAALTNLV